MTSRSRPRHRGGARRAGARRPELGWVQHGDVAAIVTDTEESGLRAASALRLHWQVLETTADSVPVLPVRFGTAMADDRAVVEELLAPRHDELVAHLAELAGKVQVTVKGDFDEERLLRGVVDASPAIARLRERVAGVPEAAAYYDRIRLGQLIAEEVEHAASSLRGPRGRAARAARGRHEHRARVVRRRRGERRVPDRAGFGAGVQGRGGGARARVPRRRRPALSRPAAALQLLGRRLATEERGMGLITGLITLPLAPVRATAWLGERLLEQAEAEYYSEERIRDMLAEVERHARQASWTLPRRPGIEDELLERLLMARELGY